MAELDRVAEVESRCTPTALVFLRQLRDHPCFGDVVEWLGRLDNSISRTDVEDALAAAIKGRPPER